MVTIIFLLSLVVLATLLGSKMYGVARGNTTFVTRNLSRLDGKVEVGLTQTTHAYFVQKNQWMKVLKIHLPLYAHERFVTFVTFLNGKYHSVFPNIRGVRVFKTERNASEFLQNISADRHRDGKGRIEDESISDERLTRNENTGTDNLS